MENNKVRYKGYYMGALVFLTVILSINQFMFTFQRAIVFSFKRNVDIDVHTTVEDQDGNKVDIYIADQGSDTDFLFIHGSIASGKVYKETIYKLASEINCNVIGYYFRGMNNRRGQPSEKGIVEESYKIADFVKSRGNKIIIYGQSLGCSVALNMANYLKVKKLILENPFTSCIDIIKKRTLIKWFSYLAVDTWDNIKRIKKNGSKLLIFASENDQIVPNDNSDKLAKYHKDARVQKLLGSTHFNVNLNKNYHKYIRDFIN